MSLAPYRYRTHSRARLPCISTLSHNATPITVVKHTIVSFSNFVVTDPSVVVSHIADDS